MLLQVLPKKVSLQDVSQEARSCLRSLLSRDPASRLGAAGPGEVHAPCREQYRAVLSRKQCREQYQAESSTETEQRAEGRGQERAESRAETAEDRAESSRE